MADEFTAYYNYIILSYVVGSVCAFIFAILLSLDAYKAFKRRALWIPGQALVLSALVIQLLTFIDNVNINVNSNDENLKDYQLYRLIVIPLSIDIRRVMICVFIGYLFPGVVRSGLITVWGDIGALALIVIWHMGYEVYFTLKTIKEEESQSHAPSPSYNYFGYYEYIYFYWHGNHRKWFIASYITFSTALILLVLLLTSAVIAGKSIRKLMSQKVPLALSCCCCCPEKHECKNIENHVLKCWIVTRASQPDYIMARSVFSSFDALVNTVCIVFFVTKSICNPYFFQYFTVIVTSIRLSMELAFILIGWIVVLFRCFTAVMYFPRNVRRLFFMEDFWTRSIVDIKNDLDAHVTARLFRKKRILQRTAIESIVANLITTFRLHPLLFFMGLWLQNIIVSFSKVCWCLSDIAFRRIRPFIMSPENNELLCGVKVPAAETDQFYKYKEALEIIRMPGENASSLWIANLPAFKQVENNMTKGFENSKGTCPELIKYLGYKTGMAEDEASTSLEDEKHFKEVGKKSWKMRAVSLIHFMIYFYDGTNSDVVSDAIQAYSQAWCFMDIVDNLDPEGQLVSLAADKEFDTIEIIWKDYLEIVKNSDHNQSNNNVSKKLLEERIKIPLKHHMERLSNEERAHDSEGRVDNLQDSRDWMAVAAQISLYKTWKVVDPNSNSVDAIDHLRCSIANIIAHCMGKELDRALIENCGKWAENGKEKEIFNAAFTAGKAKGVRDQIIETNNQAVRDQIEVHVDGERNEVVHSQVESVQQCT